MIKWSKQLKHMQLRNTFEILKPAQQQHKKLHNQSTVDPTKKGSPVPVAMATSGRVWAISDLHVDYKQNRELIQSWHAYEYLDDALIVAGDVTHNLKVLEQTLLCLKEKFAEVFFIPGNHDLWLMQDDKWKDSVEKMEAINRMCRSVGVHTEPYKIIGDSPVWVVPLFSWYSTPDDEPEDSLYMAPSGGGQEDRTLAMKGWMDNHLCKWPDHCVTSRSAYFASLNTDRLENTYDAPVISFSHFLPRFDLIPASDEDKIAIEKERELLGQPPSGAIGQGGVKGFNFTRYAGCKRLEEQIRKLGSVVHVHGHQHRNRDRSIDGVRYVSHCLGYPRERQEGWTWGMAKWKLGPKCIWPQDKDN